MVCDYGHVDHDSNVHLALCFSLTKHPNWETILVQKQKLKQKWSLSEFMVVPIKQSISNCYCFIVNGHHCKLNRNSAQRKKNSKLLLSASH